MRICFVPGLTLGDFVLNYLHRMAKTDLVVFPFGGVESVSFSRELSGESGVMEDVVLLSRDLSCAAVAGCDSNVYGLRHRSAIVADNGALLDVTDMTHNLTTDFDLGSVYRVFDTRAGKLGVAVCSDVCFCEVPRCLALLDAGFIVNPAAERVDYAFLCGAAAQNALPLFYCAPGEYAVIGGDGRVAAAGGEKVAVMDIAVKKGGGILEARRGGLYSALVKNGAAML